MTGFLHHVLRKDYGTFKLANTEATTDSEYILRLKQFALGSIAELPPYGTPLLGYGVWRSLADSQLQSVGIALGAAYASYGGVFNYLSNLPASSPFYLQIQQRFWPQATLVACVWFAVGLHKAQSRLFPNTPIAMPAATLALLLGHAHTSMPAANCPVHTGTIFEDFGASVLRALPDKPNVMLLTHGDEVLNSVRYVHRNMGERPRLVIVDQNYMQFDWFVNRAGQQPGFSGVTFPGPSYGNTVPGSFLMSDFLAANYPNFSIFVCGGFHQSDVSWKQQYRLWPLGPVSQILRRDAQINIDKWATRSQKLLPAFNFSKPGEGTWEQVISRNHYLAAYTQRPYHMLEYAYEAVDPTEQRARFTLAAHLYSQTQHVLLNGTAKLPDYFYRNMGVAFSQLVNLEPTEDARAGAKQRGSQAFMKYLAFDTVASDDRSQIENAMLSLIAPPAGFQPPSDAELSNLPPAKATKKTRRSGQPPPSEQSVQPKGKARTAKKKRGKGGSPQI